MNSQFQGVHDMTHRISSQTCYAFRRSIDHVHVQLQKPKFWGKHWNRYDFLVAGGDGRADLRLARSSCRAARSGPARQIALQRHPASLPDHPAARHSAARGLSQMNLYLAAWSRGEVRITCSGPRKWLLIDSMDVLINCRFHVESIGTNDITKQISPSRSNNVIVVHLTDIFCRLSPLYRCSSFDREVTKVKWNFRFGCVYVQNCHTLKYTCIDDRWLIRRQLILAMMQLAFFRNREIEKNQLNSYYGG